MAANGLSVAQIEKVLLETNENAKVIGFSNFLIVEDIEAGIPPAKIVEKYKIKNVLELMRSNRAEMIIIGCTHFSTFYPLIKEDYVFDSSTRMVEMIVEESNKVNSP